MISHLNYTSLRVLSTVRFLSTYYNCACTVERVKVSGESSSQSEQCVVWPQPLPHRVAFFVGATPRTDESLMNRNSRDVSFSFSTPRLRCNPPLFSIGHSHSLPQIDPFVCPKHQTIRPLASPALQCDFMSIHTQDVVSEMDSFMYYATFQESYPPNNS